MRYSDPNQPEGKGGESAEHQLRREVEDLKRLLHQQQQGHASIPANRWKPSGLTISVLLLGMLLLLAGAFVAGYVPFQKRDALVRAEAVEHEKALPRMDVMTVGRSAPQSVLNLPATMQAITEAPILARVDGYLKTRGVDIGDHVRAGQVVAEIDAPELAQQTRQAEAAVDQAQAALEQAIAALAQGKANRDLASLTAGRWKQLAAEGVVSQQENDNYQAQLLAQNANVQALEKAVAAQQSNVAAAKANLARLKEVEGYRVVKAPFDGVITQRNVDVGALVSTGSTLLYRIAQTGTLRTYLNVPQDAAGSVHVGQAARITLSNFPGRHFTGRVARTANALDPSSRTMLVEVEVPNADGSLLPGAYAEVDLSTPRPNPPLVVPAGALVIRTDGAQVAMVREDGIIHLQKVTVGRDYGDRVEILQGVEPGATILTSPGDVAREGAKIVPVASGGVQP
jgi:RND family efflux transporter MFP subunit